MKIKIPTGIKRWKITPNEINRGKKTYHLLFTVKRQMKFTVSKNNNYLIS